MAFADTDIGIDELHGIFQDLTIDMLGLAGSEFQASDGSVVEASEGSDIPTYNPYYTVRIGWPQEGQPAWKIDEDVVFLRIWEDDDQINRSRDTDILDIDGIIANIATSYTQVMRVQWTLYGPNAYANAKKIRNKIFSPLSHDTLAKQNLYLINDIQATRRIREMFTNQWWERCDLFIRFNELIIVNDEVNYIDSAEILITDGAHDTVIDITEPTPGSAWQDSEGSTLNTSEGSTFTNP
jgi:hypothetical protein